MNKHHFELHKIQTNLKTVNKNHFDESINVDLNFNSSPCKILGLQWNPKQDLFQISTPSQLPQDKTTKSIILSTLAQYYDPLGLVNPLIVFGIYTINSETLEA